MSDAGNTITIRVLDKEYVVACPPEEKDALIESARDLDARMRQLRDGGKVLGIERMSVMTALNLVHECAQLRSERDRLLEEIATQAKRIEDKIALVVGRRREVEALD